MLTHEQMNGAVKLKMAADRTVAAAASLYGAVEALEAIEGYPPDALTSVRRIQNIIANLSNNMNREGDLALDAIMTTVCRDR